MLASAFGPDFVKSRPPAPSLSAPVPYGDDDYDDDEKNDVVSRTSVGEEGLTGDNTNTNASTNANANASTNASTSTSGNGEVRRKDPDGNPLATDWVKDLMVDGQEVDMMARMRQKHQATLTDGAGNSVGWENFTTEHVEEIIAVLTSGAGSTESEKAESLMKLANITETTELGSNVGRRERHENQVRLLNAMIAHDGLAAIHEIQASFGDKRHRQMAAHLLAKIAAKIYEGWI